MTRQEKKKLQRELRAAEVERMRAAESECATGPIRLGIQPVTRASGFIFYADYMASK